MDPLAYNESVDVEELLGEWHPLVDQLGSTEGLLSLGSTAAALELPRVTSVAALESFLDSYQTRILIPLELPSILRAFRHASRNETRELIRFDQDLARRDWEGGLAAASQRAGQVQLRRLRPLRDHRLLQRYLRAAEEGRAHGWHTLVYGITLSIYSLPVLQGLVFYERQTLRGFIHAASRHLGLSWFDCRRLLGRRCSGLPRRINNLVPIREWMATSSR